MPSRNNKAAPKYGHRIERHSSELAIFVPALEEQHRIAEALNIIDEAITQTGDRKVEMLELKHRVMQTLLSDRIIIRGD